jgi:hypothetical protein
MQRPAGTGAAAPTGRDTVRERGPCLALSIDTGRRLHRREKFPDRCEQCKEAP